MIDKNTIYSYFQTDDFPTEEQFRATWDSFWHKSESIPMSQITGLNQLFQQTATVAQLNNKANVDGSNIDVSAYQEKLNITNLIATAKEEVKTELLNGAPEAFDTLKEISDWISDDETAEAAILQAIQNEATARTNADNLLLNKPTTTSNTASYPFVVGEDGNGNSARLPAGDLGKNFFNSDLNNTTARTHTMNAGVTVNTLGNPHTLSGLPNKNTDITNFRKVRVQNTSGLDSVVDSKNLLTDGMTSMSDAEKDAWRLAQRKSTENYSTGQPRIDFINPVIIDKTLNFVQYVSLIGLNLYLGVNSVIKVYRKSDDTLYKEITTFESNQNMPTILLFGENFQNWEVGKYYFKIYNGISGVESIINKNLIIDVRDTIEELSIPALSFTSNNSNVVFTGNSNNLITNQIYYAKSNEPLVTSSDLKDGVGLCFSLSYRGWAWARYASRIILGLVGSYGNISDSSLDFGIITQHSGVMQSITDSASSGSSIVTGNTLKNFTLYVLIKNGVVTIYSPEVSFSQSFIYNQVKDLFLKYGMVDVGNSSDGGEFRLNNILKKFKI